MQLAVGCPEANQRRKVVKAGTYAPMQSAVGCPEAKIKYKKMSFSPFNHKSNLS
jgi:hypothetical protein